MESSNTTSGVASKVINIDGLPRRSILKKSKTSDTLNAPIRSEKLQAEVHVVAENSNSGVMNANPNLGDGVFSKDPTKSFPNSVSHNGSKSSQGTSSYAQTLKSVPLVKNVNFRFMDNAVTQPGVDVVLSKDSVRIVKEKLACTLYGYFLGNREAFPVVDYFVKTNWTKFGLQNSMMNANGFFFFKFESEKGMMDVLQGGPWLIRNKPIFLNVWTTTTKLKKEDIKHLAIWVKLHDVPLAAYTEDGLSMLASKIGNPKLLDSYTTSMCSDGWGRNSYARAMLEISADNEFKKELTIAIPELDGDNYSKETIYVEYEWTPPRCAHCRVFGHESNECHKQVRVNNKPHPKVDSDGFKEVTGKNSAKKPGFHVDKQKTKFEYRPVGAKSLNEKKYHASTSKSNLTVKTSNSFGVLNSDIEEDGHSFSEHVKDSKENDGHQLDDEEVCEVYDEMADFIVSGTRSGNKGASTPSTLVSHG